ncbi:MAG: NAD(+)/NADH kinase [Saccharofermentanales bacterium]|jgi:NAD+ kinase
MRIGLFSNPDKDPDYSLAIRAADYIRQAGATAVAGPDYKGSLLAGSGQVELADYATCDLAVCLGGDGTFLSLVHLVGHESIPVIGVNLGSVGFLPEILPDQLRPAIARLVSGDYQLEQRMMLDVSCFDHNQVLLGEGFALNDAVVSRGASPRIVTLELTINQETVDRIPGDGLIVSTPTGSTAYSLSAGGPIIHPELSLILITPICPHTLHNRSYIAADHSRIVVKIGDYPYQALVSIDGRRDICVESGGTVVIRRSTKSLQVIRLGNDDFYVALPQKIQARGRAR